MVCPICKHQVDESERDRKGSFFPFCSERCKLIDLGRWLGGRYQIEDLLGVRGFKPIAGGYRDMFERLLSPHIPDLQLTRFDVQAGEMPGDPRACEKNRGDSRREKMEPKDNRGRVRCARDGVHAAR